MEVSTAFNMAITLVAFLGGWLLKTLFERIKSLEDSDRAIAQQITDLRAELPDRYVRRDDNKEALDNIFSMLRRIEDKLDQKADKS